MLKITLSLTEGAAVIGAIGISFVVGWCYYIMRKEKREMKARMNSFPQASKRKYSDIVNAKLDHSIREYDENSYS